MGAAVGRTLDGMASTPPDWLPAHGDLAKLLLGHTIGAREDATSNSGNFGKVKGTFPTGDEASATESINRAWRKPARLIGATTNDELIGLAQDATLYKAAAHFVSIAYANQVTDNQRNRAEEYWSRQYAEAIEELEAAVAAVAGGDLPGPDDNAGRASLSAFFPQSRLRDCYGRPRIV